MTLGELRQRMSAAEFRYWMAFNRIDPIGEQRGDMRFAQWAAMWANAHRDKAKRPDPFTADDFMPFKRVHRDRSSAAQAASLRAFLNHRYQQQKKGK